MSDIENAIESVIEVFNFIHGDFVGTDDFDEQEWQQKRDNIIKLLKEQQNVISALRIIDDGLTKAVLEQKQIVRCKDCKHKEESVSPYWELWCNRLHCGCDSDWFCADGKRMEGR